MTETSGATHTNPASGLSRKPQMILPPGWAWIPVQGNRRSTVRELFREAWETAPRDSIGPFIHRLEDAMVEVLDEASGAGGIAVVMPIGVPWQVPVSASIALSLLEPESGELKLPSGDAVQTDAGPATREILDFEAPAGIDPESLVVLRTIETTWITPEGGGYLLASATISGIALDDYRPITEALTTLILTMLDALTWKEASHDA